METKQIIVMRKKYPDGKGGYFSLRTGKVAAQCCHASLAFLTRNLDLENTSYSSYISSGYYLTKLSNVQIEWLKSSFKKIVVGVDYEEEMLEIFNKAKESGLECHLVTDSGLTEFKGVPTNTCVAIGPDYSEKIDKITGGLKLL